VKKFTIALLGVIFVALIACSIQSISADHLEPGKGIFKDENNVNIIPAKDSKYFTHLQVLVRDAQGQLVSIAESSYGFVIPHEITDHFFDTLKGKRDLTNHSLEIITIDSIKYEKLQFTGTVNTKSFMPRDSDTTFFGAWMIQHCGEFVGHGNGCISVFTTNTSHVSITEKDIITNQWTILRELG
jgi:hypothetical protein